MTAPPPRPETRPDLRAGIAVALTVLMWASSFVIMRGAAPFLSPGPLTLLRLTAATLALGLLLAVLLASRRTRLRPLGRRAAVLLVLYGVSWFAVYTIVLGFATRHLDAGTSAMLVNLAPILVAAAAGLLFGEGWPRSLFLGMGVALAGVVLISVAGGVGQVSMVGVGLALLAAVLYAGGMLLQRWVLDEVDPLTTVFMGCAAGTLVCLPYVGRLLDEAPDAPVSAVALLLSALFLAEVPPVLAVVGGALCLVGVGITRFGPASGRRTAQPGGGSARRRGRRAGSGTTSRRPG